MFGVIYSVAKYAHHLQKLNAVGGYVTDGFFTRSISGSAKGPSLYYVRVFLLFYAPVSKIPSVKGPLIYYFCK